MYFSKIFLEQGTNNKAEGYSWFEYAETKCRTKNHREKLICTKELSIPSISVASSMWYAVYRYYQQIAGGTGNNYIEIQILIYWRMNRSMHKKSPRHLIPYICLVLTCTYRELGDTCQAFTSHPPDWVWMKCPTSMEIENCLCSVIHHCSSLDRNKVLTHQSLLSTRYDHVPWTWENRSTKPCSILE